MTRYSITLLAMLAALSGSVATTTPAPARMVFGHWGVAETPTFAEAKCLLVHTVPDRGRGLMAYYDASGELRIVLTLTGFDVFEIEEKPKAVLRIDDQRYDDAELHLTNDRSAATVERYDANHRRLSLEPDLAEASRLEIASPSFDPNFDITGMAIALEGLRQCNNAVKPQGAEAAAADGFNTDDADTGASEDAAEAERVFGGEQAPEADRLGQAVQGITNQSPVFAQFQCEISTGQFFGILLPNGRSDATTMTLNIAEDGSGDTNSPRFQPAYMDGSPANGDLRSVAYSLKDIMAANKRAPEHAAPPLLNMTEREMTAYRGAMTYMQGLTTQLMGDRQRYLVVSLADEAVRFLDLTPQNQAVNVTPLDCVRTK